MSARRGVVCLLFLLAACTRPALGQGMNLAWNDCYLGSPDFSLANTCTAAGDTMRSLVLSIEPAHLITDVNGALGHIEFWFDGSDIPDYWRFDTGGCRQGQLTTHPHVGSTSPPYSCAEFWSAVPGVVSALQWSPYYQCNNRARLNWIAAIDGVTQIDPAVSSEYYVMKFDIAGGGLSCAGCATPVCIYPTLVRLTKPPSAPSGDVFIETPGSFFNPLWQTTSSTCVGTHGGDCPTPTTRSTWGQVKGMYR